MLIKQRIMTTLLGAAVLFASVHCVCAGSLLRSASSHDCCGDKHMPRHSPDCQHCSSSAATMSKSAGSIALAPMSLHPFAANLHPPIALVQIQFPSLPTPFLPIQITSRTLLRQHCALIT
jgi:hypothetical protein